jgi:hypothetical protein
MNLYFLELVQAAKKGYRESLVVKLNGTMGVLLFQNNKPYLRVRKESDLFSKTRYRGKTQLTHYEWNNKKHFVSRCERFTSLVKLENVSPFSSFKTFVFSFQVESSFTSVDVTFFETDFLSKIHFLDFALGKFKFRGNLMKRWAILL